MKKESIEEQAMLKLWEMESLEAANRDVGETDYKLSEILADELLKLTKGASYITANELALTMQKHYEKFSELLWDDDQPMLRKSILVNALTIWNTYR